MNFSVTAGVHSFPRSLIHSFIPQRFTELLARCFSDKFYKVSAHELHTVPREFVHHSLPPAGVGARAWGGSEGLALGIRDGDVSAGFGRYIRRSTKLEDGTAWAKMEAWG